MQQYEVHDRVEVQDNAGNWHSGTVINVNEFREQIYAVELDDDMDVIYDDVVFVNEDRLRKLPD